jgi:localization factor PodJL
MGMMYAGGKGVSVNASQAFMWFSLAATKGDPDAASQRDQIKTGMTPEDLAEAEKLVTDWKPTP